MLSSFLTFILPIIALISLLLYLPYVRYSNRHIGKQTLSYHFFRYTFLGYLISLLYLTIFWGISSYQFPTEYYFLNLRPFVWLYEVYDMGIKKMMEQLLLNIAMFLPYGFLLPIIFPKMRRFFRTAMTVLGTTVLIETVQYFLGRSADIDDVIMNFIGGLIGYLFYVLCMKLWRKHHKTE